MKKSRAQRAACRMLAAAILMSCLAACAGRPAQPGSASGASGAQPPSPQQEGTAEPVTERPPLVEPELQPTALENGDFERYFDEYGELPGWEVTFSEWGEGEESASFGLSVEEDNTPNTTQKLSLYNGMAEPVTFTVSQTVESPTAGEYVVACIFEGGPADTDTQTTFSVNGKTVAFGRYEGWKNWRQVVSDAFTTAEGDPVVIEISGTLDSKDWMDLDDVELTLAEAFEPKTFARFGGAVIYDRLTNGDFETGEDENGLLPGWTVEFADWGSGAARAGYRLTTESDNFNTSQKLSLGNSTGRSNPFTITQRFLAPGTGQYVVALDWEAKLGPTDFALSVNGNQTALGQATGWKNWGQNASAPFFVRRGDVITIEISGTMERDGWLDVDNVILAPAADFVPQRYPYYKGDPMGFVTMDHIQNGDFSEGVVWTYVGNPDGYLPGWILPEIDWSTWKYNVAGGEFTLANISAKDSASTFALRQFVRLAPGRYTLNAWSGWVWDENNPDGIDMSVKAEGRVLASTRRNPGWGDLVTNDFVLTKTTTVEVSFVFSLRGGASLGLDNVEFRPYPAPVAWRSAEQLGGVSGAQTTTGVRLKFDKNIPDLTAAHFTVTGAQKGGLVRTDIGEYELALSGITAADGQAITITIAPPKGYVVLPASRSVVVYRSADEPEQPALPTQIVNGDFSQGIDWSDPAYPDGKLPGWTLPAIDWDTWRFNTSTANTFEVNNISSKTERDTFTISQKVLLQPGTYTLDADSPWTWDAGNPDGVTVSVTEDGAGALVVLSMNPGYGPKSSEGFTVERETAVTVEVSLSLAGGGTAAIRGLQFTPAQTPPDDPPAEPVSVGWTGAEQTGGASGTADTTGIALTFDRAIPGLTADAFTVTGAEKGVLTDGGGGAYTLAIHSIAAADGESVTVAVTSPAGHTITPASKTVTIYRKAGAPEPAWTAVPLRNESFSQSTEESDWRLPAGWDVRLGGAAISSAAELDAWLAAHPDSVFKLGTIGPAWTGLRVYGATDAALDGFSLTQPVSLEAGHYRLSYRVTDCSWGLTFGFAELAGASKQEETSTGAASGSLEFDVPAAGTYTLCISKPGTWKGDYFELESVALEKQS